jgi:hypothetical protein
VKPLVVLIVALPAAGAALLIASRDSERGPGRSAKHDPFRRPPEAHDHLPRDVLSDELLETRRIAVYERNRHKASLYLGKTRRYGRCLVLVTDGATAGSCSSGRFRVAVPLTVSYGLGYASGRARSDVRSVVVVGTHGRRHLLRISPAGGFIYRCPAFSGCSASVRSIEAYYDKSQYVGAHRLPGTS